MSSSYHKTRGIPQWRYAQKVMGTKGKNLGDARKFHLIEVIILVLISSEGMRKPGTLGKW